jgi:hypothetical protein
LLHNRLRRLEAQRTYSQPRRELRLSISQAIHGSTVVFHFFKEKALDEDKISLIITSYCD